MTRAKVRGVDVSVLLLGWPLIRFLTEAQLAAVVAHELAHAESVRGRLSELAIRARASLVGSLDDRIAFPAAFKAGLLRSTQVDSWHEEQAADAVAAAVVGSATVQTTLERIRLIDSVWELIGGAVAEVLADEGAYPIDLYEVIEAAINDPVLDRRVRATAGREGESDPFAASTHPPLTMRIAMLPQQSGATRWMDRPVLFSGSEATEDWCVRTVFGVGARGPELSPTRALDGDLSRYENGLTEARGTLTAALGAPTWQEALPRAVSALTLDPGALGVLLDPDVRRLPQPLRADVAQRRAAGCVGAVIAAGLLDQGWQRVSPWTATVLEDPAGSEVDVVKTVHALVETRNAERLQELVDDAVGSRA
ncbi:MAG: hypothetical protein JWR52_2975 [Marmoricola sp.]|nr:hypothetical protein [Marmoricola sp.]